MWILIPVLFFERFSALKKTTLEQHVCIATRHKMLKRSPTGTWMPAWVPESTTILAMLLMICSMVQSAVSTVLNIRSFEEKNADLIVS
jgi:hypothetical protein